MRHAPPPAPLALAEVSHAVLESLQDIEHGLSEDVAQQLWVRGELDGFRCGLLERIVSVDELDTMSGTGSPSLPRLHLVGDDFPT